MDLEQHPKKWIRLSDLQPMLSKIDGNHRPSGYFAVDYCSDAVASLEKETLSLLSELPPGLGY